MTTGEFIKFLQQYPEDAILVIEGSTISIIQTHGIMFGPGAFEKILEINKQIINNQSNNHGS